jgi:GH24 family phage-related lysozyme (muramidase)
MKDLAGTLAMLKSYEGCFPYMYLDSRGYVTVGVGFWLETPDHAASYTFYINSTPSGSAQKATSDQVRAEWSHVKCQAANHLETYYQQFTTVQMQEPDMDAMLTEKVSAFEAVARKTFANWDDFPASAQLALLDMIYNLGSLIAFPKLVAYATKKDWVNCAQQCYRNGPGNQRNNETKARFQAAAQEQPLAPTPAAK